MPHLKNLKDDAKRLIERVENSHSKNFAFSNEGKLSQIDVDGVLFEPTVNALELRDFVFCNKLAEAVESLSPYEQRFIFQISSGRFDEYHYENYCFSMLVTEDQNGILTAYERDYLGGTNRSELKYELTMTDDDTKIVIGHLGQRQLLRENILSDYEICLFTSDFSQVARGAIIRRSISKQETTFRYGKWEIVGFVADLEQFANFMVGPDHPDQFVRFHIRGMSKQLSVIGEDKH